MSARLPLQILAGIGGGLPDAGPAFPHEYTAARARGSPVEAYSSAPSFDLGQPRSARTHL
jgi:hypothetical protein